MENNNEFDSILEMQQRQAETLYEDNELANKTPEELEEERILSIIEKDDELTKLYDTDPDQAVEEAKKRI